VLYRRRADRFANVGQHRVARIPIVTEHADFDELVGRQIDVDFVQHGRGQPMLPYADDGAEVVRLGAQCAALAGC